MGKTLHRCAGQTEANILPVPVPPLLIDIAIRQIDTAAVSDAPIHDQHLSMITVIGGSLYRKKRIERNAWDAQLLQLLGILEVEGGDTAEIVVHHAHIHALPYLFHQYSHNSIPHTPRLNDEVFHVNRMLCTSQIRKHVREHIVT